MSFGEELRRERELRQISLREVAEATKISVRHLEALERNEFDHLPGGVYNRGFIRNYCKFIGVDAEAMVNAYLLEQRSQEAPAAAASGGMLRGRSSSTRTAAAVSERAPRAGRPTLVRVGLLLLAVVVAVASIYLLVRFAAGEATWPGRGARAGEGPPMDGEAPVAFAIPRGERGEVAA
jgi:cytoskeletal protein RodZ